MSYTDFYDDDRKEVSEDFKHAMDYSDRYLDDSVVNRFDKDIKSIESVKSMKDAEQALTDTLVYLAAEGSKTMDSNTVALLVKTISDTRTLMTSNDIIREEANPQPDDTPENNEEKKTVSSVGNGNDKAKNASAPVKEKIESDHKDTVGESDLKMLMDTIEKYIKWPQNTRNIDAGQKEYLCRLKQCISKFKTIQELLQACIDYASGEQGQGCIFPSTIVFLLIVYLSDVPEKYIPMFVLSPIEYYESPLTHTRSYQFDNFLSFNNA